MTKFGKYVAHTEAFNSGGMGDIFRAQDSVLNREVCVKLIKKEFADSPVYRKRFKREAVLMAHLSHENIVRIYDYGVNGSVWIAMELVDGEPVEFSKMPYSIPRAISLFEQIASAINYAHSSGIAHCDIKPGNIIDDHGRFVLIDFGLGFREDGDDDTARTAVRSTGGTPIYAPPEQTVGEPVAESDIYSLGCTVYEVVTGKRPFPKCNRVQLANHHANSPRPSATFENENCPLWLSDLIAECMSIDALDRPTPSDIIDRLSMRVTSEHKPVSVFIDRSLMEKFHVLSSIERRYVIAPPRFADVIISGDLEFLKLYSGKRVYVVHVDDDDSILIEGAGSDVIMLLGPPTLHELVKVIES